MPGVDDFNTTNSNFVIPDSIKGKYSTSGTLISSSILTLGTIIQWPDTNYLSQIAHSGVDLECNLPPGTSAISHQLFSSPNQRASNFMEEILRSGKRNCTHAMQLPPK